MKLESLHNYNVCLLVMIHEEFINNLLFSMCRSSNLQVLYKNKYSVLKQLFNCKI